MKHFPKMIANVSSDNKLQSNPMKYYYKILRTFQEDFKILSLFMVYEYVNNTHLKSYFRDSAICI